MADDTPPNPPEDGDHGGAGAGGVSAADRAAASVKRVLAVERAVVDNFYGGNWARYCAEHDLPAETDRSSL